MHCFFFFFNCCRLQTVTMSFNLFFCRNGIKKTPYLQNHFTDICEVCLFFFSRKNLLMKWEVLFEGRAIRFRSSLNTFPIEYYVSTREFWLTFDLLKILLRTDTASFYLSLAIIYHINTRTVRKRPKKVC